MQTVANSGVANSECFLKMYRVDFVQKLVDKRALAKDKKSIEAELMSKLPYLLSSGGYIPFVDHNIPPDIPFDNFKYYMELKRRLLEGRA